MLNRVWPIHLIAYILYASVGVQAQLANVATVSNRCDQNAVNAAAADVLRYINAALYAINQLQTTGNVHADRDIYYLHTNAHVIWGTAQLPSGVGYSAADLATFAYIQKTYEDARKFWTGQQYTRFQVNTKKEITPNAQTFVANPYNLYITCASILEPGGDWQQVRYVRDVAPSAPDAGASTAQDARFVGHNVWFMRIPPIAPFFTFDGTAKGNNGRVMEGEVCDGKRVAFTGSLTTDAWTFRPITTFTLCPGFFNYPSIDTLGRIPQDFDDPENFATRGMILLHETFHAHGFFMHDNPVRWKANGFVIPGYRPRTMYSVNEGLGEVLTPPPYNGRGTTGFPDAYAYFAITASYIGVAWDFFAVV